VEKNWSIRAKLGKKKITVLELNFLLTNMIFLNKNKFATIARSPVFVFGHKFFSKQILSHGILRVNRIKFFGKPKNTVLDITVVDL
jgi:hypothetical protein